MPKISLTDFVDFVVKTGTPKLTKVKEIKSRPEYDPKADFWKKLREGLIEYHKSGSQRKTQLDKLLVGLSDPKKQNRYPEAVSGYKKYLGKKQPVWFDPAREIFPLGGLDIIINPELGLEFGGERKVVKLYFKDEKLTKAKVGHVLALMELALRPKCMNAEKFILLDVSNSKPFEYSQVGSSIYPLLLGEAMSFKAIWENI